MNKPRTKKDEKINWKMHIYFFCGICMCVGAVALIIAPPTIPNWLFGAGLFAVGMKLLVKAIQQ